MDGKVKRFTYDELVLLSKWVQHMIENTEKALKLKTMAEVHQLIVWELEKYYKAKDVISRMLEKVQQGGGMSSEKKILP